MTRMDDLSCDTTLPGDILKDIMRYVDPITLSMMGSCSHALYSYSLNPIFWRQFFNELIDELELSFSVISSKPVQDKYSFIWIYRNTNIILDLCICFDNIKKRTTTRNQIVMYKNQVEHIFEKNFGISSPWLHTLRDRIEREILLLPKNIFVQFIDYASIKVKLTIQTGFYKEEDISFKIIFTEDYPQSKPTVISLNPQLYHPFIQPSGLFILPPNQKNQSNFFTIVDLLNEIQSAFLDSKVLTNNINF